jgi:hypothetical protein
MSYNNPLWRGGIALSRLPAPSLPEKVVEQKLGYGV